MNKISFFRQLFIALFLTALIAGCAGTRTRESTGEFVDDTVITAKVKAAILEDPLLKVFEISVETFKGEVQLSGFVNSVKASKRAVVITQRIEGVTSVKNSMVVK